MNSLISICIPTYHRPELLRQTLTSCVNQTYQEVEIIVCDNSKDDSTELAIQDFIDSKQVNYYRNDPPTDQANNVNRLFHLAKGDRLVLIHDDDLLLPTALEDMAACWEKHPNLTACFGKQYIIDMAGDIQEEESIQLNREYYRTEAYAGLQTSLFFSALVGQFPNNGYMILTEAARAILYKNTPEVGDACDFDFGLRLAIYGGEFFFVDAYTAKYRITDVSILKGNNYSNLTYELIRSCPLPAALEPLRIQCLQKYASPAISKYLLIGDRKSAFKIYCSNAYPWVKRFSLKGLTHGLLIVFPASLSQSFFKAFKSYQKRWNFSGVQNS